MGYEILKTVVQTTTWDALTWEFVRDSVDIEKVKEWVKKNPMPKSTVYENVEEVIDDIMNASGTVAFREDENDDFIWWFIELIEECE